MTGFRFRFRDPLAPASAVAALLAGWLMACDPATTSVPDPPRPVEVRDADYVSSLTCRSCHPREYASWYATYHRTMTQVASDEAVLAPFAGETLEAQGQRFRVGRDGERFWADLPDERGRRPIVLTTGSHHEQVYWYATGQARRLGLFPFAYHVESARWMPVDAAFLRPPHAGPREDGRVWNYQCIECHATGGEPRVFGPDAMDTQVAEFGIACEACHGPGRAHVAANRDPQRRYRLHLDRDGDPLIVNPARLEGRTALDVCAQCHGVKGQDAEEQRHYMTVDGHRYRPGDALADTRTLVDFRPDRDPGPMLRAFLADDPEYLRSRFWSDGQVRVSGREGNGLLRSPCAVDPAFGCGSCHRLHQAPDDPRPAREWADDLLHHDRTPDASCLGCHPDVAARGREHTQHAPETPGSACVDCHMPYTTYGLLKAIRSHEVSVPDTRETLATGRPNACSQCHLDRTLAWAADALERQYGRPAPDMTPLQGDVAAGALWALTGDAGQRALAAWSFGWPDAHATSDPDWMVPYLAHLLDDPYDAVRFIAARSLRRLPGYGDLRYDFVGPRGERARARREVFARWLADAPGARNVHDPATLIEAGVLDAAAFNALAAQRDDRPLTLNE